MAWSPCVVRNGFFFNPLQNKDQPTRKRRFAMKHTEFLWIRPNITFLLLIFLLNTRQRAAENGSHVMVSSAGDSSLSSLIDEISLEPPFFLFWTRLFAENAPEGVCIINTLSGFGALHTSNNRENLYIITRHLNTKTSLSSFLRNFTCDKHNRTPSL